MYEEFFNNSNFSMYYNTFNELSIIGHNFTKK